MFQICGLSPSGLYANSIFGIIILCLRSMSLRTCMCFSGFGWRKGLLSVSLQLRRTDRVSGHQGTGIYLENLFLSLQNLLMFSFNCSRSRRHANDILLSSNVAVCSHHDSQDLERGTSDDVLTVYIPCSSVVIKLSHRMLSEDLMYAASLTFPGAANWLSDEAGAFSWGSVFGVVVPRGNS